MKKSIKTLICAGVCAASVAGIGGMIGYAASTTTTSAVTAETDASQKEHKAPEDDGSIMAKVSSVSGSTLTVYEAEKPDGENMKKPDGQTPPEKPADDKSTEGTDKQTPPAKPADDKSKDASDRQTPPEKPADDKTTEGTDKQTHPEKPADDNAAANNGERPEMKYADEKKSYTVSSSTNVTKGMNHETASLSDISEGSIVRIKLDGTSITSIDIMDE